MTKEELNRIEEAWWNTKEGIIAMAEVFRLAEKAIDQETCGDAISRSDAIEWIKNLHDLNEYYHPDDEDNHLIDYESAIDYLKQLPSVRADSEKIQNYPPCAECNKKMDEIRRAYDNMLERKVEFDLKVCDMDEPEDVCCNCKHNIRTGEVPNIECHCDIDGSWLSYLTVMEHKCERWESDDKINGD